MKLTQETKLRRSDDLIPMINVVFLLLIFFMVAGTLRSVEPIDIEEPISNQESNSIEQTTLLVSFDGVMYLNGELIPDGHLRSRLESSEWNANQIASSLAVKVDKDMTMLAFSEVVERLRAAGVRRVSMITANSSVSN